MAVGLYFGQVYFYDAEGLKYKGQIMCQNSSGALRHGAKVTGLEFIINKTQGGGQGDTAAAAAAAGSSGVGTGVAASMAAGTGKRPASWVAGAVQLLVTTNDSNTRLVSMADSTIMCKYKGSRNTAMQIRSTFSEDGRYVICGSETGKVCVWDTILDQSNLGGNILGGDVLRMMTGANAHGIAKNTSYEYFSCLDPQKASASAAGAAGVTTADATPSGPTSIPSAGVASSAAVAALFAPSASVLLACPMNQRKREGSLSTRASLCSSVIVVATALGTIEVFAKKFW